MHMFPAIPWLEDWRRNGVDPLSQRNYVKAELERVIALGNAPVMSMVLTAPFAEQTQLALSILSNGEVSTKFFFRLVPGANPPIQDPQGRVLPTEKQGRTLVAKVGTKGGQIQQAHKQPDAVTSEFSASALQRAASLGRDIYQYVELTHDKVTEVPFAKASILLNQYGYQIRQPRYHARGTPRQIDFWLVEEIPPAFVNNDGTVRDPKATAPQHNNPKRAA
jgi:hypothetical protein